MKNMAGWYKPLGRYSPEKLHGLSAHRFCEALRAEGMPNWDGGNFCLNTQK